MRIIPLPAFRDNYIWTIHDDRHGIVVDPGDAGPVESYFDSQGLALAAILITHHHMDHVGGIESLLTRLRVPVYGPALETIPGKTHALAEGDQITIPELGLQFSVLDLPGHTLGHIAYLSPGILFCGDTLFSAGCGRLFEGTPAQMHASLEKLSALPDHTEVYCTHEYTLSNLAFSCQVEPQNPARDRYLAACKSQRDRGLPTLPSTIGLERAINPFLRTNESQIQARVGQWSGQSVKDSTACFTALREWKNQA